MRSVILSTLLLVLAVCTVSAQNRNTSICRLGFTYDISQSKNWGNNKPVIKSIIPYSSAEQAGIKKYDVIEDGTFKTIRITLKYGADKNEKIITGIKRISKPGLRVYAGKEDLPKVLGGLGIAIISTNQGVITDKKARELQVGGEVLAFVW